MESAVELVPSSATRRDEKAGSKKWMPLAAFWIAICGVFVSVGTLFGILTNPTVARLRADVAALEAQRDQDARALKDRETDAHTVSKLSWDDYTYLADKVTKLQAEEHEGNPGYLDLTKHNYLTLNHNRILAACQNVEPYLDGCRITLELGKPDNGKLQWRNPAHMLRAGVSKQVVGFPRMGKEASQS